MSNIKMHALSISRSSENSFQKSLRGAHSSQGALLRCLLPLLPRGWPGLLPSLRSVPQGKSKPRRSGVPYPTPASPANTAPNRWGPLHLLIQGL